MPEVMVILRGLFSGIDMKTDIATRQALMDGSGEMFQAVYDEAPVESGDLRSSLHLGQPELYGKNRYRIKLNVSPDQAAKLQFIIKGARETTITPKSGQALAFDFPKGSPPKGSTDGRSIFKSVTIPARAPNNFPSRAIVAAASRITGLIASRFVISVKQ